jgi:hypothetical protein
MPIELGEGEPLTSDLTGKELRLLRRALNTHVQFGDHSGQNLAQDEEEQTCELLQRLPRTKPKRPMFAKEKS